MPGLQIKVPVTFTDTTLPRLPERWVPTVDPASIVSNASPAPTGTAPAGVTTPSGIQVMRLTRTDSDTTKYGYINTAIKPAAFPLPVGKEFTVVGHVKSSKVGRLLLQYTNASNGSSNVASEIKALVTVSTADIWVPISFVQHVAVAPTTQQWRIGFVGASSDSEHLAPVIVDVGFVVQTAPA